MTTLATAPLTDICALTSLTPGRGAAALVDGQQVAVFLLPDGEVHAIDNRDPSTGAHVLSRGVVGSVGDVPVVASPLHKEHFDLRTGRCLESPELSVSVWAVRVEQGRILVGTRPT